MTKLDEIIWNVEKGYCDADEFKRELLNAARAYSALQKLAPEIVALVEAGEKATQGYCYIEYDEKSYEPSLRIANDIEAENHHNFCMVYEDKENPCDSVFISLAANARLTLKAIHDNLTAFGKDTTDE